jgi:DNA-binding transcriptional regulator YhcF (GntR family)
MPPLYGRVWQYLKYKTNYQLKRIPMRDGSHFEIQPGQHLTSIRSIAKGVGYIKRNTFHEPNPRTIRNILNWLEQQHMISINHGLGNRQYTLITLLQWEKYQAEEMKVTEHAQGRTPVSKQLVLINKNNKEFIKKIDKKDITTERSKNLFSGESDGMLSPDSLCSDRLLKKTAEEISQTPERGSDEMNRLSDRYIELRSMRSSNRVYPKTNDYGLMANLLEQVPIEPTLKLLDQCFEDYDTRYAKSPGKKITSFKYCETYILGHFKKLQAKNLTKKEGALNNANHQRLFKQGDVEYELPF